VADPDFEPEWQEIDEGHWQRACQCYSEDRWEPRADTRTRLDPMNPSTFAHFPACEHRDTTDPVIVRAILTVFERETYWYCNAAPARRAGRFPSTPRRATG
jgi:hypothetical protein